MLKKIKIPGASDEISMPLVVIGDQRTGTNYLRTMLESSKLFSNVLEIFQNPEFVADPNRAKLNYHNYRHKKILEQPQLILPSRQTVELLFLGLLKLISTETPRTPVIDIKYNSLHTLNALWHSPTEIPYCLQLIRKYDLPVLHIWRKNAFRHYLSHQLSLETGQYVAFHPSQIRKDKITVDPQHMLRDIRFKQDNRNCVLEWLEDLQIRYCSVAYEDFAIKQERFLDSIGPPLRALTGIEVTGPLSSPFQRIVSNPLDRIANPQETRQALEEAGMGDLWDF